MSKTIDRSELSDKELIEKCRDWIHRLCESGGDAWTLRVPVDVNRDPDMLLGELTDRFEKLTNNQTN